MACEDFVQSVFLQFSQSDKVFDCVCFLPVQVTPVEHYALRLLQYLPPMDEEKVGVLVGVDWQDHRCCSEWGGGGGRGALGL